MGGWLKNVSIFSAVHEISHTFYILSLKLPLWPPWFAGPIGLGMNHTQIYLHMRDKFGREPTIVSKGGRGGYRQTDTQRDAAALFSR